VLSWPPVGPFDATDPLKFLTCDDIPDLPIAKIRNLCTIIQPGADGDKDCTDIPFDDFFLLFEEESIFNEARVLAEVAALSFPAQAHLVINEHSVGQGSSEREIDRFTLVQVAVELILRRRRTLHHRC
jgi:hypothetical protein